MTSLTDFIQVIPLDAHEEPEDIFASAPGLLYPDDTRNQHGDPGSTIVYKSATFGNIELKTADPKGEGERQLFSHYLWNSGIKLANLISIQEEPIWAVEGQSVLELGAGETVPTTQLEWLLIVAIAGVGLVGIVATLADAKEVSYYVNRSTEPSVNTQAGSYLRLSRPSRTRQQSVYGTGLAAAQSCTLTPEKSVAT